jgi:hypothetical protein
MAAEFYFYYGFCGRLGQMVDNIGKRKKNDSLSEWVISVRSILD